MNETEEKVWYSEDENGIWFFFFLKGQLPPNHLEVTYKNPKINEKDGDYILNEGDEDIWYSWDENDNWL